MENLDLHSTVNVQLCQYLSTKQ